MVELGVLGKDLEIPRWYAPPGGKPRVDETRLMKQMLSWVVVLERMSSIR